jgi:hypothetical protein
MSSIAILEASLAINDVKQYVATPPEVARPWKTMVQVLQGLLGPFFGTV